MSTSLYPESIQLVMSSFAMPHPTTLQSPKAKGFLQLYFLSCIDIGSRIRSCRVCSRQSRVEEPEILAEQLEIYTGLEAYADMVLLPRLNNGQITRRKLSSSF